MLGIFFVLLIVGAFLAMRQIGIPTPEVIQTQTIKGRFYSLAGRVFGWRTHLKYPNGRIRTRALQRGSYGQALVRAEYYDPDGNVRSRVVDGSGFEMIFDNNGNPLVLVGYINGIQSGPHFVWNKEGKLIRAEYLDSTGTVEKSYLPNTGESISSTCQQSTNSLTGIQ